MHCHGNQKALRGREKDVTLNVVGAFQEDAANKVTQLHIVFIIMFTKSQSLSWLYHFILFYPRHLFHTCENIVWQ